MSFVTVEPLQPPFNGDVAFIHFHESSKQLAVSQSDYAKICDLFGTNLAGRQVTMERDADGHHIRISVVPS